MFKENLKRNKLKDQNNKMDEKSQLPIRQVSVFSLAFEMGYLISLPIVIFVLGGVFLDKKLGSSPLYLLLGVAVSLFFSGYLVYQKIKAIIKEDK